MSNKLYPKIEITIEGMRNAVVKAFGGYSDDIQEQVEIALDDAIKKFDVDHAVKRIAHSVIKDQIENAVLDALHKLQWNQNLSDEFAASILNRIRYPAKTTSSDNLRGKSGPCG